MSAAAGRAPSPAANALLPAAATPEPWPVRRLRAALALEHEGQVAIARRHLQRLAASHPAWSEPWFRLADSHRRANEVAPAIVAYRETLDREPGRVEALIALGALLIGAGRAGEAQTLLLRACGLAPAHAEAWDALGLALAATGDERAAESAFAEACRLAPERLDFVPHAAHASIAAGTAEAELARADLAAQARPDESGLHLLRGLLLQHLGRGSEAIDALELADALAPENRVTTRLLGQALAQALRLREAVPVLRRAIALDPEDPTVQLALAVCLIRMHRPREARALLEALPPEVSVLCNLAGTIAACGSQQEAAALARRTVAEHPRSVMARKSLPSVLAYTPGVTGAELTEALVACGATLPRTPRPPIADPRPDRRLRIGLLSGSLRTHPVGWLTIGAFEALDRADFTIACFGRYAAGDALTRRFAACAESWTELDGLDETGIAAAIRDAAIDILIDLGGYGDTGHMTVCASRPAPVQMKWVGMQYHTTGLPEIDWFVTDRWETPESLASLYTERLLTMPDGYVCYSPPAYAPPVSPLPMLEHGFPTFGCCNNLSKITPVVIETWARILTARPDARLLLRTQQFSEPETIMQVQADFAAHGIDPARILVEGPAGHREFLATYHRIDVVLDPFPYSGGLTTCEALWMGVPTITMPGESFAGRHSLSHMSNAGLPDWAVADTDAYVRMALNRVADPAALAQLRRGLREHMRASPLCDAARFGAHFGAALRGIWRDACETAP